MRRAAAALVTRDDMNENSSLDEAAHRRIFPQSRMASSRSYILLSLGAAVVTISLKLAAYFLTDSVGLLSDAAESVVNLIAALAAFWALTLAARPPDRTHAYGFTKAEYFSSGFEGALILLAAGAIAVLAADRLAHPRPLENVGWGLGVSLVATAINGGVALVLLRTGRRLRSITLRADGQHLLTDVWTATGVVVGVVLVQWTGWWVLDPIVAFLVAANIAWTARRLILDTAQGLLDSALPAPDLATIAAILVRYQARGIEFHALRTRMSGQRRFMSVHVLVPGTWTIQHGHALCEQIEHDLIGELPKLTVFTHLEPVEDPVSLQDQDLDRPALIVSDPHIGQAAHASAPRR
jgi:cation diffusion facilitator family transporter